MLFFRACFFLNFIKLSAGKGFYIHMFHANSRDTQPKMNNLFWPDVLMPKLFNVVNNTEQVVEPELACNQE